MRVEHVAANELIDIALTGDREAYKARLDQLKAEHDTATYDSIVRQAAMQYRMQTKDHRFTAWRADWVNSRRGDE